MKMKLSCKRLVIAFFVSAVLVGRSHSQQIDKPNQPDCGEPLTIVALDYPPFFDSSGKHGYKLESTVVNALALYGCDAQVIHMPFARALQLAKMGNVDAMLSTWYRPEREAFLHYGPELFRSYNVLTALDKKGAPKTLENIDGLSLAIVRGYALPNRLDISKLKLVFTRDDTNSVAMLQKGRVDLIFTNAAQLDYWPEQPEFSGIKLTTLVGSEQSEGFFFAVTHKRDDHQQINDYLRAGLSALAWDGEAFVRQHLSRRESTTLSQLTASED